MFLHVAMSLHTKWSPVEPFQEAVTGHRGYEHKPEPHHQVDPFIEQVHRKSTLHHIPVNVITKTSDFKITECNTWKTCCWCPFFSRKTLLYYVNTISVEICIQNGIQHEQLAHCVGHVQQFDDEIEGDQKVSFVTTAERPQN